LVEQRGGAPGERARTVGAGTETHAARPGIVEVDLAVGRSEAAFQGCLAAAPRFEPGSAIRRAGARSLVAVRTGAVVLAGRRAPAAVAATALD
jgi:hypothetical protein